MGTILVRFNFQRCESEKKFLENLCLILTVRGLRTQLKVIWLFLPHQWVAQNSKMSPNFPYTLLQILIMGTFTLLINFFLIWSSYIKIQSVYGRCVLITEALEARSSFKAVTMGHGLRKGMC